MTPRFILTLTGVLSVALGLFLALVVFGVLVFLEGAPTEGGYCSVNGRIGRYEASRPDEEVVYLDEGWSGFPPRHSCRVYAVEPTNANPPLSAPEALAHDPPPHDLLAAGSYPGTSERTWVLVALFLPSVIWLLLALVAIANPGARSARTTERGSAERRRR